jgi:hypothetical protein
MYPMLRVRNGRRDTGDPPDAPIHLQRFAEVLIIGEGSFQHLAFSKNKKLIAEG